MRGKQSILQDLESDDELPDVYNDITILPAYLNDHRFDEIKFPWIHKVIEKKEDTTLKNKLLEDTSLKNKLLEDEDAMAKLKGILKGKDLYCLKSVESCICSCNLMWFIKFLLHKDMQSDYNFLKSCLVVDGFSNIQYVKEKHTNDGHTCFKKRFEIVIKV